MKRSPLKRKTPIKRGGKVNPINRERIKRRRALTHGRQTALAKQLVCCACGSPHNIEPDHVETRGSGGRDRGNVVPLDSRCHDEKGRLGIDSFNIQRGPFRLYHPEQGQLVPALFGTLQDAARALEPLAYDTQACGHDWLWADLSDNGDLTCRQEQCMGERREPEDGDW